ncbi:hypothetical protein EYF80_016221 [Liparis tanakae]|uniref:Uncharacterized protein n=1 Tax=Liparis tanakae TaxID=230148 RepID=A0A4Z2I6F6_9TELE|nr:hypothetical protein EYF80_016221 [Liparis tanakae]
MWASDRHGSVPISTPGSSPRQRRYPSAPVTTGEAPPTGALLTDTVAQGHKGLHKNVETQAEAWSIDGGGEPSCARYLHDLGVDLVQLGALVPLPAELLVPGVLLPERVQQLHHLRLGQQLLLHGTPGRAWRSEEGEGVRRRGSRGRGYGPGEREGEGLQPKTRDHRIALRWSDADTQGIHPSLPPSLHPSIPPSLWTNTREEEEDELQTKTSFSSPADTGARCLPACGLAAAAGRPGTARFASARFGSARRHNDLHSAAAGCGCRGSDAPLTAASSARALSTTPGSISKY